MTESNTPKTRTINVYLCEECRFATVTVHKDQGTTPFMIGCTKAGCTGMAQSTFYKAPTTLTPSHEWYVPDVEETATLKPHTREHVAKGGLLLRPIKASDAFKAEYAKAKAGVVPEKRLKEFERTLDEAKAQAYAKADAARAPNLDEHMRLSTLERGEGRKQS